MTIIRRKRNSNRNLHQKLKSIKMNTIIRFLAMVILLWCCIIYVFIVDSIGAKNNDNNHTQHPDQFSDPETEKEVKVIKSPSLSSLPPTSNKTLVILVGGLRAGETAWNSLYRNILDPNDADLALMIEEVSPEHVYSQSSLLERSRYIWYYPKYKDWSNALDLVNGTQWRKTHLANFPNRSQLIHKYGWIPGTHVNIFGGIPGFQGSGMLLFMIRWFLSQKIQETGEIFESYDKFIVTRPDNYYQCPSIISSFKLENKAVWVPEGEDYFGLCDRFYITSKENLIESLEIITDFLGGPQFEFEYSIHKNTESFLKYSWEVRGFNVQRFPRVMFTCADEESDPDISWSNKTRIKKDKAMRVPGTSGLIYNRQRDEFELSQRNCAAT